PRTRTCSIGCCAPGSMSARGTLSCCPCPDRAPPRQKPGVLTRGSRPLESLREVVVQRGDRHTLLRHRVAVADGHGVVVERVEVNGDAERGADLILAAVAAPDRAGVIEVDRPTSTQR